MIGGEGIAKRAERIQGKRPVDSAGTRETSFDEATQAHVFVAKACAKRPGSLRQGLPMVQTSLEAKVRQQVGPKTRQLRHRSADDLCDGFKAYRLHACDLHGRCTGGQLFALDVHCMLGAVLRVELGEAREDAEWAFRKPKLTGSRNDGGSGKCTIWFETTAAAAAATLSPTTETADADG
ncbi:hypothetical protein DCS_00875 [Drechmeria coniospora]|uniref:Uncharacterized protein n=1 Tax=Drechmeria coniospora TaxID=98403 RepID=A0A151GRR2_DRECN|nr:hypothetical protein DCS_00875 [Drechmeria coniospora]KYK59741.1 hypothetical protein DCS_00875 [Drechmeria coniospora]